MVDVDDALRQLGKWSKWQVLFYIILSITNTFPASWHMLAIVFLGGHPEYHCKLPDGVKVNGSIPYTEDGKLDQCSMYIEDLSTSNKTQDCPNGYHYFGEAGPTIVSEWDLVCDRSYLVETTQTVMVVGVMVGAMLFSYLSDMFGRRPIFLFSEWAMVVIGVTTAFVTNYYVFAVLRFCAGALQQITRSKKICSLHFVGGDGPTSEYPDPLPCVRNEAQQSSWLRKNKKRRKLMYNDDSPSEAKKNDTSLECGKINRPKMVDATTQTTVTCEDIAWCSNADLQNKKMLRRNMTVEEVVGPSCKFYTGLTFMKLWYLFNFLKAKASRMTYWRGDVDNTLYDGIILTGFVMACELFPAEMRTVAGTAIENFWALGMCILALLAYLIRNWKWLQLAISLPAVITIVLYWILPESIPWLAANDRLLEADKILKKAAKFNGKELPEHVLVKDQARAAAQQANANKRSFMDKLLNKHTEKSPDEESMPRYTLLDVLKHPKLRMYAIIMCLLWFVNSLVYYGLSLSTSALAGDRYLNFFLSGLVEIPAYTASIFILQKWGRRWPLAVFHIVAGVALAITLFIPEKTSGGTDLVPLIMTLNMIGKFGITGSFGTVFLYAPEIFPTTVRNQAMGISSLGGRMGNMIAPFSSLVARILPWLPGILFGTLSIIVGLLALLLPETLNRPLPQTIEDIENWSKPTKKADDIELSNDTKSPNAANA